MKILFSRKGFDSGYGRIPSPILPDGTLLSLPIPSESDRIKFSDIKYDGKSYYDIIRELNPKTKIIASDTCHLDPDIRKNITMRPRGWEAAFGQRNAALGHLYNQGVGIGDIFLYFGWFKQTELIDDKLKYVKGAPDLHVIYGYLQIGDIITQIDSIPNWLKSHPHAASTYWENCKNSIFLSTEKLSIKPILPGAGCLKFNRNLVLTKDGCSRSIWNLPDFFKKLPISYNGKAWKEDGFHAAAKGQEFVCEATDEVIRWIKSFL